MINISLPKINESDYASKGIRTKSNPMNMSVSDAQRAFDELSLDVIIPKVNAISGAQDNINSSIENRTSSLESSLPLKANKTDVLSKTNTDIFTPTADYQPATKRYVDLNVISGGVPQTRTINGYALNSDVTLNASDVGALSTSNASEITPSMDGTATYGTSTNYARADHVHPKDTSKQDKPERITTGTSIAIEDNKEYMLTGIKTLTFTYPADSFECWIKLTTAASGTITITFPASSYIGVAPTFKVNETWEISIKDSVVIAQKVGDGQ